MESTGTKYGRQPPKFVQSTVSSSGPSGFSFSAVADYFNDDVGGGFGCYRGDGGSIMTTYIPFFFTPVQWQELKRQALVYKHLVSAVPIPVDLLLYDSTAAARHLYPAPNNIPEEAVGRTYRFKNNPDSEPGRCRRTDGKKWRCSRDVAPDQKYCERHMHRGRARSRKPVEQPREKLTTADISTGITSQNSRFMDSMRGGTGGDSPDRKRSCCSQHFIEKPTKAENASSLPSNLTLSMSSNATVADPDSSTSTAPQLIQMGDGSINVGMERAARPPGGPLGEVFHSATSTSSPRRENASSPVRLNM